MSDKDLHGCAKPVPVYRRLLPVIMVVLLVGGGIWVWDEVIKYRLIPKRFGVVQEGSIYRSGQLSAALVKKTLFKYKIRTIVDLTKDSPDNRDQQAEKRAAAELSIKILRLPLRGNGTGDINNYARAVAAIVESKRKNEPVLVHCAAGTQRTGGVIAAYRLLVEREDPALVLDELASYDWSHKDNPALLPYLNTNMAELAELLKQMAVIREIPSPLPQLHLK